MTVTPCRAIKTINYVFDVNKTYFNNNLLTRNSISPVTFCGKKKKKIAPLFTRLKRIDYYYNCNIVIVLEVYARWNTLYTINNIRLVTRSPRVMKIAGNWRITVITLRFIYIYIDSWCIQCKLIFSFRNARGHSENDKPR